MPHVLSLFERFALHVALVDIDLPEGSGDKTARRVRGRAPRPIVVAVSGTSEPDYPRRVRTAGVRDSYRK